MQQQAPPPQPQHIFVQQQPPQPQPHIIVQQQPPPQPHIIVQQPPPVFVQQQPPPPQHVFMQQAPPPYTPPPQQQHPQHPPQPQQYPQQQQYAPQPAFKQPPPAAAPSPKVPPKSGFVVSKPDTTNSASADQRAAKLSIDAFTSQAKTLNTLVGNLINPLSKQKTLLQKMSGPKAGEQRNIVLNREQKNEILTKARPLLESMNQFIFDFNRFGKTMAEREYNAAMLTLGQLKENLEKFAQVVVKSETVKVKEMSVFLCVCC